MFDVQALLAALGAMDSGARAPRELQPLLEILRTSKDLTTDLPALVRHLSGSPAGAPEKVALHLTLARWDDATETDTWTAGTKPQTPERRLVVHDALALPNALRVYLDEAFPLLPSGGFVIAKAHTPWYDADRQQRRNFYWRDYKRYLIENKHWDADPINDLDKATTQVVERLTDPASPQSYQAKGLVVGYVQSGKTANFTGVLAKAIDSGYRLVIVLTGTVDILRKQTQRRLDKELVGVENIIRGIDLEDPDMADTVDYRHDSEWIADEFLKHGVLPSLTGYPDVIRLTRHETDYKGLEQGITALELEKREAAKPLFDLVNLDSSHARLAIVKKNSTVLGKLVKDLRKVKSHLAEIPVLIIDDESDQASINTTDPSKKPPGSEQRSKINGHIAALLKLLPRAQYVGYTATPFANVFVDPGDAHNTFPKDFLIGLDRPTGYMGGADFHDLDFPLDDDQKNVSNSNERAHIRNLVETPGPERDKELQGALDAFVLAGAIKLFREHTDATLGFRHHTMLVHESVTQVEHRALADDIKRLWDRAGYGLPVGLKRLKALYDTDFLPVTKARAPELPTPKVFDELKPHLGETVRRLGNAGNNPVLIINGDKDIEQEALDFDTMNVWRILVGGTKLSRGFTVEGLTVSYYRRKAGTADTLMQMGRWFGYRKGYRDLVRLYVGRKEPYGVRTYDLYRAFEAVVRDEEAFRGQLARYAKPEDGKPIVTPMEIPPLVSQHLPGLRPASRNKMFNARLVVRRSPGVPLEPTAYPLKVDRIAANYALMSGLLSKCITLVDKLLIPDLAGVRIGDFPAYLGTVDHAELLAVMRGMKWIETEEFGPDLAYLEELADEGLVDGWLLVNPQQKRLGKLLPDVGLRAVFQRQRREGRKGRFGVISESKHRPAALRAAGARASYGDTALETWVKPRMGSVLLYPVVEDKDLVDVNGPELTAGDVTVGVVLVAPKTALGVGQPVLKFTVKNLVLEDEPVVDAQPA